jgi:hypothetical protein
MSNDIERLRYFERQYLRSFDFTAEQNYHLEMRRRLSRALHLWGIVKGLELLKGELVEGTQTQQIPEQFYVSDGMAVDAYGREIIVPAKHLLADDLTANRITGAGTYSVWIGYTRQLANPPEAGYLTCDPQNQSTRWQESFEILITSLTTNPNPTEDPDPFGDLSDDPDTNPWWVHLGTISVDGSQTVVAATNANRIYIGLRTQRIVAPRHAESEYNILSANKPLDPLTSIGVRDNLFVEQNLIAGTDFVVDPQKIQPPPNPSPPASFPNPTGNIKIASDVFLQGNLYTHCDLAHPDLWFNLDECIRARVKNLIPETHIGTVTVPFVPASTRDSSGAISASVSVTITTQLAQVDDSANQITTSIAGIKGKSFERGEAAGAQSVRSHIIVGGAQASTEAFEILTSGTIALNSDGSGTYVATLTCTIGPAVAIRSSPQQYEVPVDSVFVSYVVILSPPKQ